MSARQDLAGAWPASGSQALPTGEYPGLPSVGRGSNQPMQQASAQAPAGTAQGSGDGSRFMASGASSLSSKSECQDQQCAEEECDPEECGDEKRAPRNDNYTCGIDRRPLLPFALLTSTMLGALCMLMKQRPLLRDMLGSCIVLTGLIFALYAITMFTMAYCALCDPGQLQRQDQQARQQLLQAGLSPKQELPMPTRAHKTWLYALPIRRYDHYCRWLTNVIGLLNHREFIIMCIGLVGMGVFGVVIDAVLMVDVASRGQWSDVTVLLMHFMYSMVVVGLAAPILRLHAGFISRNELANEWKNNNFYVVHSKRTPGTVLHVTDLSDDEFNERFDSFCYDETRNPLDKGMTANCMSFWCTPRWSAGQLGDF